MSNTKHCPHCHCSTVIKFGKRNNRQRYYCKACKTVWSNIVRPGRLNKLIWDDFVFRGYRIIDLADKYSLSKNTVRKILDKYVVPPVIPPTKLNYYATMTMWAMLHIAHTVLISLFTEHL